MLPAEKKLGGSPYLKVLGSVMLITLGTLILSFGTAVFILPFDMVVGGVSGIAILLEALIPWKVLTVDLLIAILTWGLFLLGWLTLGKDFAAKTLVSAAVYPIGIALFGRLTDPEVLGGTFYLQGSEYPELALILSAAVGGALVGAGCAVTFLGGGSTGGIDILAFLLCKCFKRLKSSTALFLIDAIVVLSGVFLFHNLLRSLLGVLSAMISAWVVDKLFLGGSAAFVAQIVTDRCEAITQAVIERLERTVTVFDVTGGYSKKSKKMLTVTFSVRQYATLRQILHEQDPNAFVTIHRAYEINGEGWTEQG